MAHYSLSQTLGADMETRFYADGRRISREEYDTIVARAIRDGRLDCLHTKGKQFDGGRIRRTNYSQARW